MKQDLGKSTLDEKLLTNIRKLVSKGASRMYVLHKVLNSGAWLAGCIHGTRSVR